MDIVRGALTNKDIPDARLARLLVREPRLVLLEAREPDGHLGHDAREDRTEALVQREWRLARGDQCARREKPARLRTLRIYDRHCTFPFGV